MFPSTLLKVSLCAILASVVGVNAQSGPDVTCGDFPLAAVQDCELVVQSLFKTAAIFVSDGGQANFTIKSCMGKVLFSSTIQNITAPQFAGNLQPILDTCRVNDPMSGEVANNLFGSTKYQLFRDPVISQ